MVFDTGSPNVWALSAQQCYSPMADIGDNPRGYNCSANTAYNHNKSSSYMPDGTSYFAHYGNGSAVVAGFFSKDTITLQDGSGNVLSLRNAPFVEGTNFTIHCEPSSCFFDGVFGLGPGYRQTTDMPPLDQAVQSGILGTAVFTLVLGATGGTLTIGGVDSTHCGPKISSSPVPASVASL